MNHPSLPKFTVEVISYNDFYKYLHVLGSWAEASIADKNIEGSIIAKK